VKRILIDCEELLVGGVGSTYNLKILRGNFYRYVSEGYSCRTFSWFFTYIKGLIAIVVEKVHLDKMFIDDILRYVDRIERDRL